MRVEMTIFNKNISRGWNCVSDGNWLESMGAMVANQGIGGVEAQMSQSVFAPTLTLRTGNRVVLIHVYICISIVNNNVW
jgi:hypothetical protein